MSTLLFRRNSVSNIPASLWSSLLLARNNFRLPVIRSHLIAMTASEPIWTLALPEGTPSMLAYERTFQFERPNGAKPFDSFVAAATRRRDGGGRGGPCRYPNGESSRKQLLRLCGSFGNPPATSGSR